MNRIYNTPDIRLAWYPAKAEYQIWYPVLIPDIQPHISDRITSRIVGRISDFRGPWYWLWFSLPDTRCIKSCWIPDIWKVGYPVYPYTIFNKKFGGKFSSWLNAGIQRIETFQVYFQFSFIVFLIVFFCFLLFKVILAVIQSRNSYIYVSIYILSK